jgi:hypothetical protein
LLDELALDPNNVRKHGLSYIVFSCIQTKGLYLLIPLQHKKFHIDLFVVEEMNRLNFFANWTTLVPQLIFYCHSHVIIQVLNTNFLNNITKIFKL